MVPSACCDLNGCKILRTGLFLLFLGITWLYGGEREGGLNFLGARGPCVQGTIAQGCIRRCWLRHGWRKDSGELDRSSAAALVALGLAVPTSSLFPCSSSPQPRCFSLTRCITCEPVAEQPAKGTVAARLVSPLAVMCRGLASEQPGAEVSCPCGRQAPSRGSWCFPVGKQCIFSLKSLPSEGVPGLLQAAEGRRCSAVARCHGDAASLHFPSKPSLELGLPVVLLQNKLSKRGAQKAAGMGSGRSTLSPPLLPSW